MGSTAIAGIGYTKFSKDSGVSVAHLALEASMAAISDAGVPVDEVDAIVTYAMDDSVRPQTLITGLGLPRIGHYVDIEGGGQVCAATLAQADMLIQTGRAQHVLIYRAMNGRSGHRLGGQDRDEMFAQGVGEAQYNYPHGWVSYPQYIAMAARRHMLKYGTTSEAFGEIALTCRENAVKNERAMMRKPMTREDYDNARMIVDPFRLYDICLESDGACALLVTSTEEAEGLNQPVVNILSAEQGGGPRPGLGFEGNFTYPDLADLYGTYIREATFGRAGVTQGDIDVCSFYDCFTFSVLAQIEGFGFCGPGESPDFVSDGRLRLGGELPINTNGGMLSEAYIHGLNGIVELVSQLRGHAGERQVHGARIGLATGFGSTSGCAAVLARG